MISRVTENVTVNSSMLMTPPVALKMKSIFQDMKVETIVLIICLSTLLNIILTMCLLILYCKKHQCCCIEKGTSFEPQNDQIESDVSQRSDSVTNESEIL